MKESLRTVFPTQDQRQAIEREALAEATPGKYVDQTGTMEKPNPMRDVYLEFPRAMLEVSRVTAYGAQKHAPRGWQTFDPDYALDYHLSKIGRHLIGLEMDGPENEQDDGLLHAAQMAWNALAYLEHYLRREHG